MLLFFCIAMLQEQMRLPGRLCLLITIGCGFRPLHGVIKDTSIVRSVIEKEKLS